jgi:hypothetical protein
MEIACEITVGLRSDGRCIGGLLDPEQDVHSHSCECTKSNCDSDEKPDCTEIERIPSLKAALSGEAQC